MLSRLSQWWSLHASSILGTVIVVAKAGVLKGTLGSAVAAIAGALSALSVE